MTVTLLHYIVLCRLTWTFKNSFVDRVTFGSYQLLWSWNDYICFYTELDRSPDVFLPISLDVWDIIVINTFTVISPYDPKQSEFSLNSFEENTAEEKWQQLGVILSTFSILYLCRNRLNLKYPLGYLVTFSDEFPLQINTVKNCTPIFGELLKPLEVFCTALLSRKKEQTHDNFTVFW